MDRDEICVIALSRGYVTADAEGHVWLHRGQRGSSLEAPRLTTGSSCNGYRVLTLHVDGQRKQVRMHRLVWIAHFGKPPEGMVIAHENNDKADNRILNLYLTTPGANSTDAARDGLYRNWRKLTPELADQLAADYHRGGESLREIAKRYGVSRSRAQQIASSRRPIGL